MGTQNAKPILFVVSGPSGSGKRTFIEHVIDCFSDIRRVATYTTRSPRSNEKPGFDYNYISENEFLKKVKAGEIFEHTKTYGDYYYGSPSVLIDGEESKNLITELDFKGFCRLKATTKMRIVGIFLLPPTIDVLKSRINKRAEEDNLGSRLAIVYEQAQASWIYDYVLLNDDIKDFESNIATIIKSELLKREGASFLVKNQGLFDQTLKEVTN